MSMIPNIFAQPSPLMAPYTPAAPTVPAPTLGFDGNTSLTLVDNVSGGSDSINLYGSPTGGGFGLIGPYSVANFPLNTSSISVTPYFYYATSVKGGTESVPSATQQSPSP